MTRPRLHHASLCLAGMLLAPPSLAQAVATYHNHTAATHQQQYNTLSPQGYRMIALSIYGTPSAPLYAAVWVQRPGPAYAAFHGLNGVEYQTFSNTWWPLGYRPRVLSATGTAGNPRFAGVWEQTNAPGWTSHGRTQAEFLGELGTARTNGLDITAIDIYGAASDPRYIVAFGPVDAGQETVISFADTEYQEHFNALAAGHARPVLVAFNDAHRYVSLWQSNEVGPWVAHSDMTSSQYQNHISTYQGQGRYPISVQGSGSGSSTRFAAVWAPTDVPPTPPFTITGQAVLELAAFDGWAQNFMTTAQTRSASLAVARNGKLVLARGYTRALPGYPITQPTSLFEIASCTKPLTSIAMHQHFQNPQANMAPTDTMLHYFTNVTVRDPLLYMITLNSLLTHQGGWDVYTRPHPDDVAIANALNVPLPITKSQIRQHIFATQTLDFTPNTASVYCNFGFNVLGQVLEARNPGSSYEQIVHRGVFVPLGITRPRISGSLLSQLYPGEVTYHPWVPILARSVMSSQRPWVAGQYGALNKGNMDSFGGWVLAAPDLVKVLAAFDLGAGNPLLNQTQTTNMWSVEPGYSSLLRGWFLKHVSDGQGGQVEMYHHDGILFGAESLLARRADGLSFVFLTNGDHGQLDSDLHGTQLSDLANRVTSWPTHDLFPRVGLPAFQYVGGTVNSFGIACLGSSGRLNYGAAGTIEVGGIVNLTLGNAPPNNLAFQVLGLQQIAVPLDPLGATGCTVYANPLATWAMVTDPRGSATLPWRVPPTPLAIGALVFAQAAVVDPAANLLGLTTTDGLRLQIGGWR